MEERLPKLGDTLHWQPNTDSGFVYKPCRCQKDMNYIKDTVVDLAGKTREWHTEMTTIFNEFQNIKEILNDVIEKVVVIEEGLDKAAKLKAETYKPPAEIKDLLQLDT